MRDVQTVEHAKYTEELQGLPKMGLQDAEELVGNSLRWCCNCKVINLVEEEDVMSVDVSIIQTWFMRCTFEVERSAGEDVVDYGGPKTWGFWVAL